MKYEDFERELDEAKREFTGKKKQPTTPAKQFERGAVWAWQLLMSVHEYIYYEEVLRSNLIDREGEVKQWKESLVTETAKMMADRDGIMADIADKGRLLTKYDKNMNQYEESNPLYVHLKELQRTIGMQREHLGLSNKVNVDRMTKSATPGTDDKSRMIETLDEIRNV